MRESRRPPLLIWEALLPETAGGLPSFYCADGEEGTLLFSVFNSSHEYYSYSLNGALLLIDNYTKSTFEIYIRIKIFRQTKFLFCYFHADKPVKCPSPKGLLALGFANDVPPLSEYLYTIRSNYRKGCPHRLCVHSGALNPVGCY